MVSLGYIRQEKDSKRYRVGRPLFALAASSLDEIEMVSVATPVLEDLSRETGESSHFAVRMGDAVVVIARTSGPGAFQLTDRVGVVRPAHCTALGKVISPRCGGSAASFLERVELAPSTDKSITEIPVLLREIEEVRRSGIAFDDGEFNLEVRCVAVPVTKTHRPDRRCRRHLRADLAPLAPGSAEPGEGRPAAADRLSAEFGARGAAQRCQRGSASGGKLLALTAAHPSRNIIQQ